MKTRFTRILQVRSSLKQTHIWQDEEETSPFQWRVLIGFSGFVLGLAQLAGTALGSYLIAIWQGNFLLFLFPVFTAFFYVVLPLPVSFLIAYRTGQVSEGRKVGRTIGCTGAVFAMLFAVIIFIIGLVVGSGVASSVSLSLIVGPLLLGIFALLQWGGSWLALAGGALGGILGVTFKKRRRI